MRFKTLILAVMALWSCKRTSERDDAINSSSLHRTVQLTILHTPIPTDRSLLNLLILNDGQDVQQLGLQKIVDSLFQLGAIKPLVVVAVHAGDRTQEYGVAGKPDYMGRGALAEQYDQFINSELYAYAKKQSHVRKFSSVVIAGWSLGGLSAFDIAWNHPDKIDKVGVFSGSFWWRDKAAEDSTYTDAKDRIMFAKLKSSRKKPRLQYWFYVGDSEETADRNKNGVIDVVEDTRDIINLIKQKNICGPSDIVYKEVKEGKHETASWRAVMPDFLLWAFGKSQ